LMHGLLPTIWLSIIHHGQRRCFPIPNGSQARFYNTDQKHLISNHHTGSHHIDARIATHHMAFDHLSLAATMFPYTQRLPSQILPHRSKHLISTLHTGSPTLMQGLLPTLWLLIIYHWQRRCFLIHKGSQARFYHTDQNI